MTPEFIRAVGGMADLPRWFAWRLQWTADDYKYSKTPCALDGSANPINAGDPANWHDYRTAVAALAKLPRSGQVCYALGFWLTTDCGYWLLDLDHALDAEKQWLPFAQQLVAAYPGAMVERSSSGAGLHVIGRGQAPLHRNKPERNTAAALAPLEIEFYTKDRGIAFGLDGHASGCADTQFDLAPLCATYFPPRPERDGTGSRDQWRGPANDDELIRRMLSARVSAAAAFGGKASLPQLWRGDADKVSENDMALASHLAFWTGCDEERIERLMLRSGMRRDKWGDRRPGGNYLTYTITRACDSCDNVYQEPESAAKVTHVAPEMFTRRDELLSKISAAGDEQELLNSVVPEIAAANISRELRASIESEAKRRLRVFGNPMPLRELRAMLFPPSRTDAEAGELPGWASRYCYVKNGDWFYNVDTGGQQSYAGFRAEFDRHMPITNGGRRENAAEKCLHFWNMRVVHQVGYRPDQGPFYDWDGVSYANSYTPASLPAVASEYTVEGQAGIEAFKAMLWDMCGRRDDVFSALLYWMAHNVQKPGVKIRWSPIIKGVQGDGKTLASMTLRAAMGYRNVCTTSNSNISNSGGFTDWAVRGAVNVIEEIMLTGKQRHQLYNAMKEFISNNVVDVNPKGAKPYQVFNVTNHIANTNHNDVLPLEPGDRRWLVIFTPWGSLDEMRTYCGLDAAGWKERTDAIDYAKENCAGELRAWFLSLQIPAAFSINGDALVTQAKQRMTASSADDSDSVAATLIGEGGIGISRDVVSSGHLTRALEFQARQEGITTPKTTALNHTLSRMGYSQMQKVVKWNGTTCRVWLRNGVELDNDGVRLALDKTLVTLTTGL